MFEKYKIQDFSFIVAAGLCYLIVYSLVCAIHPHIAQSMQHKTGWLAWFVDLYALAYLLISSKMKSIPRYLRFISIFSLTYILICYFVYLVFHIETVNVAASSINFDIPSLLKGVNLLLWVRYVSGKIK